MRGMNELRMLIGIPSNSHLRIGTGARLARKINFILAQIQATKYTLHMSIGWTKLRPNACPIVTLPV